MKTSIVLAAISASLVVGELSPPDNFPACGTTCFNNMLGQASQLGCGGGGSTADAVDAACLCKNVDFSYGIIDCSNAACSQGDAPAVVQYGLDWCGANGVVIGGLSATADPSVASSATATVSADATTSEGGTASATTATNSDDSSATSAVDTTTLTNSSGEATATGVVIPISTTEIVSTVTNSDGAVETTTVETSTIFSTSGAASGSGTESGSATESTTFVTDSTITASGSTLVTSATVTEPVTSTEGAASSTDSAGGVRQTAAPVGLMAAAGLAALLL
ncbi:hypothetical protein E0Z10_g9623 [Xylaria hypoxylon]|uniref:CFEM domain-containing protein n=1 Tax=Xylaria hypoxylon TaxID=37992 RepID=A0A4Z0YGR0_9PEZI|nr:hypothetical protein E0Z10_g9623 [Xylaria hypoxylon]